ncbi:ADP-ribosylglycohydrolase family protein [Luteolibacter yonseiensis]|uniref:ADP-ribosylglycohydrolase family protein n=1 Tax=Luteolibacter yonseiensis TaxID=1144680 RepID=A0A934VAK5_9BACT|nr:ADP-ribosylglycohydrolase family protein [Luteolibacter yonseiensis]MBK1814956.1 ADP-ribosylglycohydrolase family protein [Luteolibacter yonseiensis]
MTSPSDIVFGAFIGDALALGPHWIYDQNEIRERLGRATTYQPPLAVYHQGKAAGDQTHYGDQALVLLRTISKTGRFNLAGFAEDWRAYWEDPRTISYRDGATKATLAHLSSEENPPSSSNDIAGAARIGPLFLLKWETEEELLLAVRVQTAFTHGDPVVIESALFFARVILAVRSGDDMETALRKTIKHTTWHSIRKDWLDDALASAASDETDAAALKRHGLTCHAVDAFPGICHLLLRHPTSPAEALIENANAGGDSAARGMILGMVYAAAFPVSDWPADWLAGLNAREEITNLIGRLP